MPKLRLYHVDAFTSRSFRGNPAAVVPLARWLPDPTMQAIAAENNLSETAFFVPSGRHFELRWFTPAIEVELCGHATLASAFVLFTELEPGRSEVEFETRSGRLHVWAANERLAMSLPRWSLRAVTDVPAALAQGLHAEPLELWSKLEGDNLFAVYGSEAVVRALQPDFRALATLHPAGVVVTAPGDRSDCVCRYFAPSYGVAEDPGTGSVHCGLTPYWAERLGKRAIHSRQLSSRGAELFCSLEEHRVRIEGQAVKYLEGWIHL
jgi:PhzF family phenazine biosynthesis protein